MLSHSIYFKNLKPSGHAVEQPSTPGRFFDSLSFPPSLSLPCLTRENKGTGWKLAELFLVSSLFLTYFEKQIKRPCM